jgi:hypothetical protein
MWWPMTSLRTQSARIAAVTAWLIWGISYGHAAEPELDAAVKAAASCSSVQPGARVALADITVQPAVFQIVGADVLCVKGEFTFDSPERMKAISKPAEVKYLVIESGGGIVLPAIRLAKLAKRHHWILVLSGGCYSSCANYVFLADTDKFVLQGAFVGWHGLPISPKLVRERFDQVWASRKDGYFAPPGSTREQAFKYSLQSAAASEEFLHARNISPDLPSRPPDASSSFSPAYAERYKQARLAGAVNWTYSRRTLTDKWKVKRIISMWEPADREETTEMFQRNYGWRLFFFD